MKKSLIVPIILNKRNGQANFSIPKKQLDIGFRELLKKKKKAIIILEGFE